MRNHLNTTLPRPHHPMRMSQSPWISTAPEPLQEEGLPKVEIHKVLPEWPPTTRCVSNADNWDISHAIALSDALKRRVESPNGQNKSTFQTSSQSMIPP